MENSELDVEAGFPVESKILGEGKIIPGRFPKAKYAVATHFGHYKDLCFSYSELEKWGQKNKVQTISCPTEFYPVDPNLEPDPNKWQTIIVQQLSED